MRSFAVLLTLGLASSVMAAPAPVAAPGTPFLSAKDPMALHRRTIPQIAHSVLDMLSSSASHLSSKITTLMPAPVPSAEDEENDDEFVDDEEYYGTYGSYEAEVRAWEDRHVQCAEICKVRTIEGAKTGQEALCSAAGLESTLACAQCIDTAWPEDEFDNSAMSEYTKLELSCEASAQSS